MKEKNEAENITNNLSSKSYERERERERERESVSRKDTMFNCKFGLKSQSKPRSVILDI